jgi:hypothetical protein
MNKFIEEIISCLLDCPPRHPINLGPKYSFRIEWKWNLEDKREGMDCTFLVFIDVVNGQFNTNKKNKFVWLDLKEIVSTNNGIPYATLGHEMLPRKNLGK